MKILKFERYGTPRGSDSRADVKNVEIKKMGDKKGLFLVTLEYIGGRFDNWMANITKDEKDNTFTAINMFGEKLIFKDDDLTRS